MTSFKRVLILFTCLEMPVNITQYRGSVGIFNNRNFVFRPKFSNFKGHKCWSSNHLYFKLYYPISPMNLVLFLVFVTVLSPRHSFHVTPSNTYISMLVITAALIFYYLRFKCNLLLLCGDVELNPELKQNTSKITDSNILPDDSKLEIPDYNLVRSDHPSNKKRGGVCIYYKSYLPLRIIDINYLNECVRFELMVGDKLCDFIALHRSPNQSQDLFKSFKENLELNLEFAVQNNPFLIVLLGDCNAKSSNWCKNDITTTECKAIENISSQFGLYQMINEPTHILESSSSCIDLIFTTQPNLITEPGVHPTLHPNFHHQIIFNLEIHYPPPYFREVWYYQEANTDLIRRAIDMFDWDRASVNTYVNEKVFITNKTILKYTF